MRNRGSFLEHYKKIRIEGFEIQKLLTECIKSGIVLKNIRIINDTEIILIVMDWDYNRLMRLVKNKYKVTILYESGYKPILRRLFSKKSTIIGLILFTLLMYYQSSFVSEIRIYGYKSFTESAIRESLKGAGFYEGCSKKIDLNEVKLHIYQDLDNIAWIGIKYIGNMAEVTIAEGTITSEPVDITKPCNVVASKSGYVEKIIAKEGVIVQEKGAYVNVGDVLISGQVPITSTAYGTTESALTARYVHAEGEAYAKVPYRLKYYQDRYKLVKKPTGRQLFGIYLKFGNFSFNSAKFMNFFDKALYQEKHLIDTVRPLPIAVSFCRIQEVEVEKQEREQDDLNKKGNSQARMAINHELPENVQILNKDLKFTPRENIIEVDISLETLEEIGKVKEIFIGEPAD
ncbi:MAG: sporulation protein YqfD [Anaerovoracaceae bacterium]|jgi:similar to stage IV sporulation protein